MRITLEEDLWSKLDSGRRPLGRNISREEFSSHIHDVEEEHKNAKKVNYSFGLDIDRIKLNAAKRFNIFNV